MHFHRIRIVKPGYIFIEESHTGDSVASDPDAFLKWLGKRLIIGSRRIFYRDLFGNYDEIVRRGNQFSHFTDATQSRAVAEVLSVINYDR